MPGLPFKKVKISLFLEERGINIKISPRKLTSRKILVLTRDPPPTPDSEVRVSHTFTYTQITWRSFLKVHSHSVGLGPGLSVCISNTPPGGPKAALGSHSEQQGLRQFKVPHYVTKKEA